MCGRKATSFLNKPQTLCLPGANRPKGLHSGDSPGDAGQRTHEKKSFPAHWQVEERVTECLCFPTVWHLCGLFPRVSRQELSCIDTCVGTYVIDIEECVCMRVDTQRPCKVASPSAGEANSGRCNRVYKFPQQIHGQSSSKSAQSQTLFMWLKIHQQE